LRPAVEGIGPLSGFDFDEHGDEIEAFRLGEPGHGRSERP
jgi:hypothetical protein